MEKPWYPSCKATHFVAEIWPFKRGGLSSGVRITHLCLDLHCPVAFSEGLALKRVASQKGFHCISHLIGRASLVFILRDVTRFTVLLPRLVQ